MNNKGIMKDIDEKLKIKIITTAPFPIGMAGSNRIMTYAKGLVDNDCNVSVVCMKTTENPGNVFNTSPFGQIDGISYKYPGGKTIVSSNIIKRRIDDFYGLYRTCFDLLKEKQTDKTDAIIFYSFSFPRAIPLFLITRLKKNLFLVESSEFPSIHAKNVFPVFKLLYIKLYYHLFDGFLLMTKRLIKYFVEEKGMKTPYLHVPMTVDFNRFNTISKNKNIPKYIAYCGVLNNKKDGVDVLIDAFIMISKEFKDINLYLIGDATSQEELNIYEKKIKQNGLTNRVIFTGRVSKDAIPELLLNATILVLARPESIQAEGGFPTKLGEYLATGNPVVVTRVGEIPDYLTDGVNVFMAEPGITKSLYIKIHKILHDYCQAVSIAKNGKKVAMENFNYKIQTKKIVAFIRSLQQMKFKQGNQ